MPVLANLINADLRKGFTVAKVAEKHSWTENPWSAPWPLMVINSGYGKTKTPQELTKEAYVS